MGGKIWRLFPMFSTIITLTTKLLYPQGYHQVKLFYGQDSWATEVGRILINLYQYYDHT